MLPGNRFSRTPAAAKTPLPRIFLEWAWDEGLRFHPTGHLTTLVPLVCDRSRITILAENKLYELLIFSNRKKNIFFHIENLQLAATAHVLLLNLRDRALRITYKSCLSKRGGQQKNFRMTRHFILLHLSCRAAASLGDASELAERLAEWFNRYTQWKAMKTL